MNIGSRVARLENAMGARRVFCVRRYEGETADEAFAAERPGETTGPIDLVVAITDFSGLSRAEAGVCQSATRSVTLCGSLKL